MAMPDPAPRAEFDAFAAGYDGGISDPLKRLAGKSVDTFFEHKVDWLLRNLSPTGRLLDFGCGTGIFLRTLRRSGAPLELFGCDISASMVDAARAGWNAGDLPVLQAVASGRSSASWRACRSAVNMWSSAGSRRSDEHAARQHRRPHDPGLRRAMGALR